MTSVAISRDNRYILSASGDQSIKVTDLTANSYRFKEVHEGNLMLILGLICLLGYIKSVVVSRDNKYIISASEDNSIKMFDMITKKQVHHFKEAHEGKRFFLYFVWHFLDEITCVIVSRDNRYIISGSDDNTIKVFDMSTKTEVHHITEVHDSNNMLI